MNTILDTILKNLTLHENRNAFCINEQFYTYADFRKKISGITEKINHLEKQTVVGIITTDSLETYASIIALWLNQLIFVPISPSNTKNRNRNCIEQANISTILSPSIRQAEIIDLNNLKVIETASLTSEQNIINHNSSLENILYILFTSGSTGTPKGVPITLKNLNAFVDAFFNIGYPINNTDRFLQIFDFTFDLSVQSYISPLIKGACIYTVPQSDIKFINALKILTAHKITFAELVPSTLNYFKPYFDRINLPELKYSLFCGEALPYSIAQEWSKCVPNASIENHYGPTEATIHCLHYKMKNSNTESHQGIMSIGKPFNNIDAQIINEKGSIITSEDKGELIINGSQVTKGYINNDLKNKESFIEINKKTYYKTGDIVFKDNEGNYFYCGRIDNQIQIQGYRVEIGEIEFQVKKLLPSKNIIVTTYKDNNILSLALFIEGKEDFEVEKFENNLKSVLPYYMHPKKINFTSYFPLSTSGKTNIKQLQELL